MIEDFFESFHMMDRTSHTDALTGTYYTWTDGAQFSAGCALSKSSETRVADQQGAKTVYNIVVPLNVSLSIGDRIKRDRSGTIMRVISNPEDMTPPAIASSAISYKKLDAEVVQQ